MIGDTYDLTVISRAPGVTNLCSRRPYVAASTTLAAAHIVIRDLMTT